MSTPIKLSTIKPDFPSLLMQLQLYLQAKGTWSDLQTSGTGQTLLELMAAVGAFNQFAIESAVRETALTTAMRDSSIYAITRMLGVRIHRKSPASVEVDLRREGIATTDMIAVFTQFDVNGLSFFNRYPIMFVQGYNQATERLYYGTPSEVVSSVAFKLDYNLVLSLGLNTGEQFKVMVNSGSDAGTIKTVEYLGGNVGNNLFQVVSTETGFSSLTLSTRISLLKPTIRLHQGTIVEETFTATGEVFQQYALSQKNFNVSDIDVEVRVSDDTLSGYNTWDAIPDGLWLAGAYDMVYHDSTSGNGEALITFGDGLNGVSPKLGSTIKVRYSITDGAKSNNGLTNLNVSLPSMNNTSGLTVSVISNGADEKPASYYRTMAPYIFKARNRGITSSDYKAVSLDYPGIMSASVQSQRNVAPSDLRWMNQIQICLLPSAQNVEYLTNAEWDSFLTYMQKRQHAAVRLVGKNPVRQFAEIDVTLALKSQYVVSAVAPQAEQAIKNLFKRQSDTLGRRIAVSDVTRAAMVEGVDYVVVNRCHLSGQPDAITDLVPIDDTHYLEVFSVILNAKYSEREIY